jgi:hypothetical protein
MQSEGIKAPNGFGFNFRPLWQMTEVQKAEVADRIADAVTKVYDAALLSDQAALKDLRQSSRITGVFSNITDEDIAAADSKPPASGEMLDEGGAGSEVQVGDPGDPSPAKREPTRGLPAGARDGIGPMIELPSEFRGLPIFIETARGENRRGGHGLNRWQVTMPAHYGYIRRTSSAEGPAEAMDCFVGPDANQDIAWVIDQVDPVTGAFDEHKVMLGFKSATAALACYQLAYHDGGKDRISGVTAMKIADLVRWLEDGNVTGALAKPKLRAV